MIEIETKDLDFHHLDDVMEIEALAYGEHHWSRASFEGEINNQLSQYLCAVDKTGKCLGYLGMWKIMDEAHITTLAVHPDHRKNKIAQKLLIASIERCYKDMIKYITLEVRVSNIPAINLYEKFGFSSLGLRKKYYQDNNEDAMIMWTQNIFSEKYKELFNKNKEECGLNHAK